MRTNRYLLASLITSRYCIEITKYITSILSRKTICHGIEHLFHIKFIHISRSRHKGKTRSKIHSHLLLKMAMTNSWRWWSVVGELPSLFLCCCQVFSLLNGQPPPPSPIPVPLMVIADNLANTKRRGSMPLLEQPV